MLVVVAVGGVELETSDSNIPGRAVYQYNPGTRVRARCVRVRVCVRVHVGVGAGVRTSVLGGGV